MRRLARIGLILGIALVLLGLANTLFMLFCLGALFAIDRLIVLPPLLALPAAL